MYPILLAVLCGVCSPIFTTVSWQDNPPDRGEQLRDPPGLQSLLDDEEYHRLRRLLDTRLRPSAVGDAVTALVKALERKDAIAIMNQWTKVVQCGPDAVKPLLLSMHSLEPEIAKVLRNAFEAIAAKALREGRSLPTDWMERFLTYSDQSHQARHLAYEWLCRVDPKMEKEWLPKLLSDPDADLRRYVFTAEVEKAEKLLAAREEAKAKAAFRKILSNSHDANQVETIAARLEVLGEKVDLVQHFGFITSWQVIGPFDNLNGGGFGRDFPPEKEVNLRTKHTGKFSALVGWQPYETEPRYGMVDLNHALGRHKAALGYAFVAVELDKQQPVDIRVGSENAVQVFVNGKRMVTHEEYHRGYRMDQLVAKVWLKAGRNEILVKVCQNDQKEQKAQAWSFLLRICDNAGRPVPVKVVP